MLRDYYLAIACEMCGVTPHDVMVLKKSNRLASTARRAVIYALYSAGGISGNTAGAMMGVSQGRAWSAIRLATHQLCHPRQYPLFNDIVKALDNVSNY